MKSLDRVRQALEDHGCRPRGDRQISALCPVHEDSTPSLSVGYESGQVLVNCHAGCATEDVVVGGLGLPMSDLFDEEAEQPDPGCDHGRPWKTCDEVAQYHYTDEHGEVLYTQRRYRCRSCGTKTFMPQDPATGKPGLPKGVRVLYRLPEVRAAAADHRTVYVVEGEKDADRLASLGHAATTAVNGAKAKWEQDYTDALKGADVIVVADNDTPGLKRARAIEGVLGKAGRSVRVVKTPLQRKGADVSDHLDAGMNLGELVPLDEGDGEEQGADTSPDSPEPAAAVAWETPVSLDLPEVPPFPVQHLGPLRAIVDAVSESIQVASDLPAMVALNLLSTAVGGRRFMDDPSGWREQAALFTVVLLSSGERKSPAIEALVRPFEKLEIERVDQVRTQVDEWQLDSDILQARLKSAKEEAAKAKDPAKATAAMGDAKMAAQALRDLGPEPSPFQFFASDATPEQIVRRLASQGGRLTILDDEGGIFDTLAGRYTNGVPNFDNVLKGYTGRRILVNRGNYDLDIPQPALSINLCVQPAVLEDMGARNAGAFRGKGLFARFLFSLPEPMAGRRRVVTDPVPSHVAREWEDIVGRLITSVRDSEEPLGLPMSQGARARMMEFRGWQESEMGEGGDLSGFLDWGNKFHGQLARIALLLTLAEDPAASEISEQAMASAVALKDYFLAHARVAYDLVTRGQAVSLAGPRRALRMIRRIGAREFSVRDLHQRLKHQSWGIEDTETALGTLAKYGWVIIRDNRAAGVVGRTKSPTVFASPWIWEQHGQAPPHNPQNSGPPTNPQGSGDCGEVPPRSGGEVPPAPASTPTPRKLPRPKGTCRVCREVMTIVNPNQTSHPNCDPEGL